MLQRLEMRKVYETRSAAARMVSMLSEDDEDNWTYKVLETREAEFVIGIYSDDGDFIQYWSE